jgi:hypothetical protein
VTVIFADVRTRARVQRSAAAAAADTAARIAARPQIVGWTHLATTMTAQQAMALLDRLYQRFDTLSVAHGVYKGAAAFLAQRRGSSAGRVTDAGSACAARCVQWRPSATPVRSRAQRAALPCSPPQQGRVF